MDWRRWASIARLSIRKMCCPNGSKKLLAQKIFTCLFLFFRPFRLFVFFRNYNRGRKDFPHEVRFFAGIGPAHFPAETTRPLGRGCLPFSPSFSRCKVTKSKFGTVQLCPFVSIYVQLRHGNASFLFRCKVTKSKFGNVQICPILSI